MKKEASRIGKYEVGKTLGEGNFGKVKLGRDLISGEPFALKILEKSRIQDLNQIKREIGTLKLLKHPNVVTLHEVLASKSKIYMVLEYVRGGELFDVIASEGKLSESRGRKVFQELIEGVSYCHSKGVFHRDLKLENVLVDGEGRIKISDFGLSAVAEQQREDGLFHTTCGSPNYVAPEVLANRGYDGATSDLWSCGVILYVLLTGSLPFDHRNLPLLYQMILRGAPPLPPSLSPGARHLLSRLLDPDPASRITAPLIKAHPWFRPHYVPWEEDHDDHDDESSKDASPSLNAFQLIGMSSSLDLSGFFEQEDVSQRNLRFTSNHSPKDLLLRIHHKLTLMGFSVRHKNATLKVTKGVKCPTALSVTAEVFEISPSLNVVELRKSYGDTSVYRQLWQKLSTDLGVPSLQPS